MTFQSFVDKCQNETPPSNRVRDEGDLRSREVQLSFEMSVGVPLTRAFCETFGSMTFGDFSQSKAKLVDVQSDCVFCLNRRQRPRVSGDPE